MRQTSMVIEQLDRRLHLSVTPVTLATISGGLGSHIAVDSLGDIFGTTPGSNTSSGTIFEIPTGTGTVKTLATFGPSGSANTLGYAPVDLVIDSAGNLFGVATSDAIFYYYREGEAFPSQDSEIWELPHGSSEVQVRVPDLDGGTTVTAVDGQGDIFGDFYSDFFDADSDSAAFILSNQGNFSEFVSTDNFQPSPINVTADTAGDTFVTYTIFSNYINELTPPYTGPGTTVLGGIGGTATDLAGNLYENNGTFIQEYNATTQTASTIATLPDGATASGSFTVDTAGDVYAVATGGTYSAGAIIELPAGGSSVQTLASNSSTGGVSGLITDQNGNLFGTTADTIFELPGIGAVVPEIASLSTYSAYAGGHLTLNVTGLDTHFTAGQTTASVEAGITVDSVAVTDATHATVTLDLSATAATGFRPVSLTTGSETVSLGDFQVLAPVPLTIIGLGASITPPLPSQAADATFTLSIPTAQSVDTTVQYTTADGSAVSGTDYTASSGTATIPAGQTSTTINVPLLPATITGESKSFSIVLSNPSSDADISTATATATLSAITLNNLSATSHKPTTWLDSAGEKVRLTLDGTGTATAYFVGGSADPADISVTGTTSRSSLLIAGPHGEFVPMGGFDIAGPMALLSAADTTLTGTSLISGKVSQLELGNSTGGVLNLAGPTSFSARSIDATSIDSTVPLRNVRIASFASGSLAAPSVATLSVSGNLGADLITNGSSVIHVGGQVTEGTWTIGGSLKSLYVGVGTDSKWNAAISGDVGTIKARAMAGTMSADTINAIDVATLSATISAQRIGSVLDKLEMNGAQIFSAGTIESVDTGSLINATIFAGVAPANPPVFPSDPAEFSNASGEIDSLIIRTSGGFNDSKVAAPTLGRVDINGAINENGGVIGAEQIVSFQLTEKGHKPVKLRNVSSSTTLPSLVGTNLAISLI